MRLSCRDLHHRALAGGTSISQLEPRITAFTLTPPCFSRWYFNFPARSRTTPFKRIPPSSAVVFQFHTELRGTCDCISEVEVPPAKARWCPNFLLHLCSCEIEVPPAKARWRKSRQDRRISDAARLSTRNQCFSKFAWRCSSGKTKCLCEMTRGKVADACTNLRNRHVGSCEQ